MSSLNKLFIISILAVIINSCGGNGDDFAKDVHVSVAPSPAIVIHAERMLNIVGTETVTTRYLPAPNMQFKLDIDNQSDSPITVLLAHLVVTGPKGQKNVYIYPANMFDTEGAMSYPSLRSFMVEVMPNRKATCMHKVDYLELASTTSGCPSDLEESLTDTALCCPVDAFSLNDSMIYAAELQDFTDEELSEPGMIFQPYQFQMTLIGWYGTSNFPESNFRKTFNFNSNGL